METALTISSYQSVPPPSSQSQVGIGQQNTIVGERGHTVSVYMNKYSNNLVNFLCTVCVCVCVCTNCP